MRIAIYGAGGVGAAFGGRLALAGNEVVFVARGAQLAALRAEGLRLESPDGERRAGPFVASDDPAALSPVEVVLLAVKTWQVAAAAATLAPLLGEGGFVVPLQNGVESADLLVAALGRERVVGGLCGTVSFVVAPGRVRSLSERHFVRFGELDGRPSERCERLRRAFDGSGIRAEVVADVPAALWEKLAFVVPVGAVGAATGVPVGEFRGLAATRELLERGMREVVAVGRARGVALGDDLVARSLAQVDALAPDSTSSLQRDLAAGRPSELDAWLGAVVRLGVASGVPTPVHDVLHRALLPRELAARARRPEA